jgi:predicted aspartyl protease
MGALCALALGFAATPALADGCNLKMLASLTMTPLGPGGRVSVPVGINGADRPMLLDTGGGITNISETAAKALQLHIYDGSRVRLLDSQGNATHRYVTLDSLQIGALKGSSVNLMVTPNANASAEQYDGELAGDLLSRYDVEMDFAAHKLNYFAPAHCEGSAVYWQAPVQAAIPISLSRPMEDRPGLPARIPSKDTHIRVKVMLDGKPITAVINTGQPNTTLSAKIAKYAYDLTADSPGAVHLNGGDPAHPVFGHVFSTLSFEGVTVSNPHIVVRPDLIGSKDPDNTVSTGSLIQKEDDNIGADLTIGMDVLKHLHLYIAYQDNKLYLTPAAEAAPTANP